MTILRDVLTQIRDAADDLAHIDVITLTGQIELRAAVSGEENRFRLGKLYQSILSAVSDGSSIKVVAYSRKDPDLDAIHFVTNTLSTEEKELLATHCDMVRAAEEGRTAFLRTIADLVGL
jgi:hypothetical protein